MNLSLETDMPQGEAPSKPAGDVPPRRATPSPEEIAPHFPQLEILECRYVRRWKVERLFAWLFNFRRLVVRYEYHAENFLGFVHLAAAIILLRHL